MPGSGPSPAAVKAAPAIQGSMAAAGNGPSAARMLAAPGAFACLKGCEARGEYCACCQDLDDVKDLRELLALRERMRTFEVVGDEPYVGPPPAEAIEAMARAAELLEDPSLNKFCDAQLRLNQLRFEEYKLRDERREEAETRRDHMDFYGVTKVDTHLHLSALLTSPELLAYVAEVLERDGAEPYDDARTVGDVIRGAGFAPGETRIDDLQTQATSAMYRDFENFNLAFSPLRSRELAKLFFSQGVLGGKYLRDIVKRAGDKAAKLGIILEPRISVYGRRPGEWHEIAEWYATARHPNVVLAIQLPRVYHVWKKAGAVANFGEMISNFFAPLFAASRDPAAHPALAALLADVRCVDTVDNEARADAFAVDGNVSATDHASAANPSYSAYHLWFWANLRAVNRLRAANGLNALELRPHCGEAGPVHHLATAWLFADGISHGINLEHQPVLQYCYYLAQVGVSVSPISNARLFVPYAKNPFPQFFKRGLRVTLTTDDPLQFAMSNEPLLEEYTTARHAYEMSMTDLSECARNSVLISSLSPEAKERAIGGDDPCNACNLPRCRFDFRHAELSRNLARIGLPPPRHPLDK